MTGPLVLCVGGLATNGPGLDADREAVEAAGARFAGAVTAKTIQDETGLLELGARDPAAWRFDALAAVAMENPACIKTGLLPGVEHVEEVRHLLGQLRFDAPGLPWVLDPVLGSSKGDQFLGAAGREALLGLLDLGPVLCPNLDEAAILASIEREKLIKDPLARVEAGLRLLDMGASAVVLKGGHGEEDPLLDLVCTPDADPIWISQPRVPGSIRGSGCRHGAYLAGLLVQGRSVEEAARGAGAWVKEQVSQKNLGR